MSLRKITSLTSLLAFLLLLLTSSILYVMPQGKIAFWANWNMLGLDKAQWGALHTNVGILFLISGIIHTLLNWKPIVSYLKNKARKLTVFTTDFNIALALTLFIVIFTLFEWPPISGIQHFNETLKEAATLKHGEPPYGHAETSSLRVFCKRTGLDLQDSIKKLEQSNLQAVSADYSLAAMANANDIMPQQLYEIIQPEIKPVKGMPEHPRMGFGRKKLSGICSQYSLDLDATIKRLRELGIEAQGEKSMKDIAEQNDTDPHALYETIRQLKATQ